MTIRQYDCAAANGVWLDNWWCTLWRGVSLADVSKKETQMY